MNTAMAIRLIGVLIGIGLLLSYSTLYNGFLFITKWQLLTIAIGLAELGRWGFGILAAILMWRLHPFAKWSLLIAFVCGLFGSWVSFIPFFGYLMHLADEASEQDPARRVEMGVAGKRVVARNRGARERLLELVGRELGRA